jgi:hypothetical protein
LALSSNELKESPTRPTLPGRRGRRLALLLAAIPLLVIAGGAVAWCWPKTIEYGEPGTRITGHYVGFLPGSEWWPLRARYFWIRAQWRDTWGDVEFSRYGYNPFESHYPDGSLRVNARCLVQKTGNPPRPVPDFYNIQGGDFFTPDGKLASRVTNGTGTQTLFEPTGMKSFELEVRNLKRVHLKMWHRNGQLMRDESYVDGLQHGRSVSFAFEGRVLTIEHWDKGKFIRSEVPNGTDPRTAADSSLGREANSASSR